jgi:hypothetical protein
MKNLLLLIASITLFNCSTTTGPDTANESDTFTVYKTEYKWDNNEGSFLIPLDTTNLSHYWYTIITHDFDIDEIEEISVSAQIETYNEADYLIKFDAVNYLNMKRYYDDFRNGSQTIVKLVLNQAYKY